MISTLTGDSNSKIKNKWSNTVPYSTGVDVICTNVYAVAYGQVVYIGKYGDSLTVDVKSTANEVLRYGHLKSCSVEAAQTVSAGEQIGIADSYVHFEYATSWQGDSKFPVRIATSRYFKQNPQDILDGTYTVTPSKVAEYAINDRTRKATLTDAQKVEMGIN